MKSCETSKTRAKRESGISVSPTLFAQVRDSREERDTRYNSMRLFALSTRPLWHGVCVPASIMAQGRTTFGALIAIGFILVFPHQVPAQQSTAPPSSLSTTPLAPVTTESELRPSCDLCRKPERRPEAICVRTDFTVRKDCVRTRTRREPIAQWTKASSRRCLVIHSRPQKVRDSGIRKQEDLLSKKAEYHRRLLPKRTHSKISTMTSWPMSLSADAMSRDVTGGRMRKTGLPADGE